MFNCCKTRLKGRTNKKYQDEEFKVNDYVEHKLYGKGKIVFIKGIGDNSKIAIEFRGNMVKKFIKKYANLKKVSVND